jgi:hypothetical protein
MDAARAIPISLALCLAVGESPDRNGVTDLFLPLDDRIGGVPVCFQWIEADGGASRGAAFSSGLEMIPGS